MTLQVHITPNKGFGAKVQKASPCSTPAPTPIDGGYALTGPNQRLAAGILVGYTGSSGRELTNAGRDERANACWELCSFMSFPVPFYFSVQMVGSGACYCSEQGYVQAGMRIHRSTSLLIPPPPCLNVNAAFKYYF